MLSEKSISKQILLANTIPAIIMTIIGFLVVIQDDFEKYHTLMIILATIILSLTLIIPLKRLSSKKENVNENLGKHSKVCSIIGIGLSGAILFAWITLAVIDKLSKNNLGNAEVLGYLLVFMTALILSISIPLTIIGSYLWLAGAKGFKTATKIYGLVVGSILSQGLIFAISSVLTALIKTII